MYFNVIFAGFGGQGVLATGSVLVNAAMKEDKYVTWMPSYGVEMRGGTASCTVVISDEEIGSPVIGNPLNTVIFNLPSKEKFVPLMKPGGLVIINSSLIVDQITREDVDVLYMPLNHMADELGEPRALNMIGLGAFIEYSKVVTIESAKLALVDVFSKKPGVVEINKLALEKGASYVKENLPIKAKQLV